MCSLPHARGGVSGRLIIPQARKDSSPRPWGCFPLRARLLAAVHALPHARGGSSGHMSVCARLAGSSSHQWGWLRRELAELDADARAHAEADSSAVRSEFNAARAKFDPNLDIQLIDSASLPEHLRELVEKRPSAEGLWNNGSIYLLENRISPGRVRKVLLHEVVAHEGLRRVFGKDYDCLRNNNFCQYRRT